MVAQNIQQPESFLQIFRLSKKETIVFVYVQNAMTYIGFNEDIETSHGKQNNNIQLNPIGNRGKNFSIKQFLSFKNDKAKGAYICFLKTQMVNSFPSKYLIDVQMKYLEGNGIEGGIGGFLLRVSYPFHFHRFLSTQTKKKQESHKIMSLFQTLSGFSRTKNKPIHVLSNNFRSKQIHVYITPNQLVLNLRQNLSAQTFFYLELCCQDPLSNPMSDLPNMHFLEDPT